MKTRFTAVSISSTHMKMMIALRRVSTPTTPIVNNAAESARDSASTRSSVSSTAKNHSAVNRHQQQHARQFKSEQIFVEQRSRDSSNRTEFLKLFGGKSAR